MVPADCFVFFLRGFFFLSSFSPVPFPALGTKRRASELTSIRGDDDDDVASDSDDWSRQKYGGRTSRDGAVRAPCRNE